MIEVGAVGAVVPYVAYEAQYAAKQEIGPEEVLSTVPEPGK
jgi:hypothetical protein